MSPLAALDPLDRLRARPLVLPDRAKALPLGWPTFDALLPDGGLPRAAVVELAAAGGLGRITSLALAVCAAAQRRAAAGSLVAADSPWCAWVDSSGTLYAPGARQAGVALERLLVVRPPQDSVARVAVRLAASHAFAVIVVDRSGVPGAKLVDRRTRWSLAVRRLALAVEGSETTIVLLSTRAEARAQSLPVAMRLELARPGLERMSLTISKERHGRLCGPQPLELRSAAGADGS